MRTLWPLTIGIGISCQPLSPDIIRDLPKADENTCEEACGMHAHCDTGACQCDDGFYGDPLEGCEDIDIHTSWIGSPCVEDNECDYEDGFCMASSEGYPEGHCSQWCDLYCPDLEGTSVTFCIEPTTDTGGHCFSRCDDTLYPLTNGCRPEYTCVPWQRFGTNDEEMTCVPATWIDESEG